MDSGNRHTWRKVALVGGAAFVAWWLLRDKRWRSGAGTSDTVGDSGAATPGDPCRLWIRADQIEVDGARTDLTRAVARCRERGRAEVHATGAAITRSIMDVLRALQHAGVSIEASPELLRLARLAVEQTP